MLLHTQSVFYKPIKHHLLFFHAYKRADQILTYDRQMLILFLVIQSLLYRHLQFDEISSLQMRVFKILFLKFFFFCSENQSTWQKVYNFFEIFSTYCWILYVYMFDQVFHKIEIIFFNKFLTFFKL